MSKTTFRFTGSSVDYFFPGKRTFLQDITDHDRAILVTDENIYNLHQEWFHPWKTIVLKSGERYKNQQTIDEVIQQLIGYDADRSTSVVGVGGGVITDLTGFAASVYMRGISFGFVPTSLLAMVDAAIGGKNGIDVGAYKNMVGTIRQPSFILFEPSFLDTLPDAEWKNGFAEIIKHACIKNQDMFEELEKRDIAYYRKDRKAISSLIKENALLKTSIVKKDEFETGGRRLLNFGHTLGHALEKQYDLSHGQAISIGMAFAATLSEELTGFKKKQRIDNLLGSYGLPVSISYDREKVFQLLKMDKNKSKEIIRFVLLQKIGKAVVHEISFEQIYEHLG